MQRWQLSAPGACLRAYVLTGLASLLTSCEFARTVTAGPLRLGLRTAFPQFWELEVTAKRSVRLVSWAAFSTGLGGQALQGVSAWLPPVRMSA